MRPRVHEAREQRKAFIEKFDPEPCPSDPVFFDADKDVPTLIERARLTRTLRRRPGMQALIRPRLRLSENCTAEVGAQDCSERPGELVNVRKSGPSENERRDSSDQTKN